MSLARVPMILLAATAALALGACDKSGKSAAKPAGTEVAAADPKVAPPADGAAPTDGAAKEGEEGKLPVDLSEELLGKLTASKSEEEAATLEEEIWDAWLLSGSPTVDILMKRGVEAQESEDIELARDMYDRAIIIKPDYAEAWNRRALLFFNDGKYDEAMADLESTLTYEPKHFGAWIGLGMIFESIDRPDAALKAYRKALEVHPYAAAAKQGEKRLVIVVEGRQL